MEGHWSTKAELRSASTTLGQQSVGVWIQMNLRLFVNSLASHPQVIIGLGIEFSAMLNEFSSF